MYVNVYIYITYIYIYIYIYTYNDKEIKSSYQVLRKLTSKHTLQSSACTY